MGEVYRARDTTLGRDVALKILPSAFASDPGRLARFEREAKLLATLNHPHIAQIFGVEDSGSVRALVMELVEGEDLAHRLTGGAIPLAEALPIARQIAEALETAHESGIVHRDLKPANIKMRPDGTVKVLDFGLAKAVDPVRTDVRGRDLSHSPTFTEGGTQLGVILGTAAYMAPEQATGKRVDRQADIWAFGVLLFEMLTGRLVFAGETATEVLASIVKDTPDWTALPSGTPASIQRLLRRCLEKDPARRLRHIGDAILEIDEASRGAEAARAPTESRVRRARAFLLVTTAIALTAVATGLLTWRWRPDPVDLRVRKFHLPVTRLDRGLAFSPTISPDGRRVAYSAGGRLWIRALDGLEPREVPSSRGATAPFWSADGRTLGFELDGKLWTATVESGEVKPICNVPETGRFLSGAWASDGTIVFAVWRGSLYTVPDRGGDPVRLQAIDPKVEIDFHDLSYLPGGHDLLFATHRVDTSMTTEVLSGSGRRTILKDAWQPLYSVSGGHLLHLRGGGFAVSLWAIPFTVSSRMTSGTAFPVMRNVLHASVSGDETLVVVPFPDVPHQLFWVDRSGKAGEPIGEPQTNLTMPALSPDGRRVAVAAEQNDELDIWIHEVDRGTRIRLTSTPQNEIWPVWSPQGDRLVFTTLNDGIAATISLAGADGGDKPREIAKGRFPTVTGDGQHVVYVVDRTGDNDLWYSALADSGPPGRGAVKFLETPARESRPESSPDGRWIAYVSDESGRNEVYVRRFPDGGARVLVSRNGGSEPRWRGDGKELFYLEGDFMMAAEITLGGGIISAGVPRQLFSVTAAGALADYHYDVSADGRRFVMIRDVKEGATEPGLLLVENWFAEFRGRK